MAALVSAMVVLAMSCGDELPRDVAVFEGALVTACNPPNATPNVERCDDDSTPTGGIVSSGMALHSEVTVRQLTSGDWNMITYYDVPAVVAGSDRFLFSRVEAGAGNYAATMTLSGTEAKRITSSPESGGDVFLTPSGAMAYFPYEDPATHLIEVRAVDLDGATCDQSTIVSGLLPLPVNPNTHEKAKTQLSNASRSCATNKWVIAVATNFLLYRFKGKVATGGAWASMGSSTLRDRLYRQPFHRIRLSPTCPNIVMYSRNREDGQGDKDIYLANLDTLPEEPYLISFGQQARDVGLTPFRWAPSHEMWSHDGLRVSYTQSTAAGFEPRKLMVSDILNPDCTFRTVNPDGTSNLRIGEGGGVAAKEAVASRTFKGNVIAQNGGAKNWVPKFCSWSADDRLFACSGYKTPGERSHAIYLLNPASGATRLLALTKENPEGPYVGQSHLQFAGDKTTVLFDSDRFDGTEYLPGQVYKLSYPDSLLP